MKMTEKEAIEALKLQSGLEITGKAVRVAKFFEGLVVAEEALEEIQQYRAIGLTPQMVKDLIESCKKHEKNALGNAHIVDEYSAIGTVEECRKALKKQIPMKPIKSKGECFAKFKDGTEGYEIIYSCPSCGSNNLMRGYPCKCGKMIDWED